MQCKGYRRAIAWTARTLPRSPISGCRCAIKAPPQQALAVIDHALTLAPDNVERFFNRALALIDLGERDAADDLIERSVKADPDFAERICSGGFMLLKRGNSPRMA